MPEVSVVAPAFDEAECIEAFVVELCAVLAGSGSDHEVLCVDDGSTDGTLGLLHSLAGRFPGLRVVALEGHHGQSAAMAAGIRLARGRFVALMDADLQNDPADLRPLLELVRSGSCDCAVGVRTRRRDRWLRRFSSRLANWCSTRIVGDRVTDAGCGIKVGRADVLKTIPFFRGAHRFLPTLARVGGARVVEVPVNHRERAGGQSKYGSGLGRTLSALRDAFGVRWLSDRAIRPQVREL